MSLEHSLICCLHRHHHQHKQAVTSLGSHLRRQQYVMQGARKWRGCMHIPLSGCRLAVPSRELDWEGNTQDTFFLSSSNAAGCTFILQLLFLAPHSALAMYSSCEQQRSWVSALVHHPCLSICMYPFFVESPVSSYASSAGAAGVFFVLLLSQAVVAYVSRVEKRRCRAAVCRTD